MNRSSLLIALALGGSLLLSWFVFSPHAAAQEIERYTVREGDTCGTIAERYYGSARRYDRIHEHNPSLGALPHRLHAGMVLELPLPRESSADATVTDARGSVRAQLPAQPSWSGARVGEELYTGARVSTGERSSAELTFRSSTVAAIRAETLVIVHGGSVERVREEGSRAVLREGSILSRLSSLSGGAPLVIETEAAEVVVSEGETAVRVTQNGSTSVSASSGRPARVRTTGASGEETLEVPVGRGTRVHRGERPTPPRPLPTAPQWALAEGRSVLGVVGRGGTMSGAWLPAENAASYRVEISRREDGRDLVYEAEVSSSVTRFEAYQFPPGTYYVRISTIDAELLEGRPPAPEAFEVVGVRLVAPGEILPVPGESPVDILEQLDALADAALFATSAPPAPEALVGTRVVVPDGVVCAAGASDPSHELVLSAIGDTFLTCVSAGGATIGGIDLRVVSLRARVLSMAGEPIGALPRDEATSVRVVLDGAAIDTSALVLTADGVVVGATAPDGEGGLATTLTPASSAASEVELTLALRDTPTTIVGTTRVAIADPEPVVVAPPPISSAVPDFALHEGLGLFATPSWVGLRDEQRTGIGGVLGLTVQSARLGEADPRVRMVAGVTAGLFDDYLRISAVAPLDILGQASRSADRGARDLFVALGSRVLSTEDGGGAGLAFEVGMWAPTAGDQGLDRGRLSIAGDFSLRFLERLALRTRQSGIFDLAGDGSMLWASAYGLDVSIVGPLSMGIEGTMTIGYEDGRDWYAGGVGLGIGIDVSPVVISIAGRYGFGDDLFPTATLAANMRASFDP